PVAGVSVRLENNHVLWAAMALLMVARAATLAVAARRFLAAST
ncbi:MAG: MATE family efflux transporter, partial [Acidobacteria bacterium]|nr:MATE family efflux transporter [Acidobacteriota bacterium]